MYIGTSLGRCLVSIMNGERRLEDVVCIITRTECPTFDSYMEVVRGYHALGNPYSRIPREYDFDDGAEIAVVEELARQLWYSGRIHQPRVYGADPSYIHAGLRGGIWLEIVPPSSLENASVRTAYEHYKLLAGLAQDATDPDQ